MPPKKNLRRGCLSNWCDADADEDADADADSSKTICRPPPYGGVDIKNTCHVQKSQDIGSGIHVEWNYCVYRKLFRAKSHF